MRIFVTFDYEPYFGTHSGSVEKCITGPTEMLTEMARQQGIKLCHFVDIGFLLCLEKMQKKHPHLNKDHALICRQLDELHKEGHDLQLHIHPHWEDSYYDGSNWICKVHRYKLDDFNDQEIRDIISTYTNRLKQFNPHPVAFRAGGWCIQPFSRLKNPLWEAGIRIDSSVFPNGHFESDQYQYDFRNAPLKGRWNFSNDPLTEDPDGTFTEIPISSIFNSPLFYWRLFLLGRLNPYAHKPLGDGVPIPAPGQRFSLLTRWTHNTVSVDGYNASILNRALKQQIRSGNEDMVIIGHQKSLSRYGLKALEKFVSQQKVKHRFCTYTGQINMKS